MQVLAMGFVEVGDISIGDVSILLYPCEFHGVT